MPDLDLELERASASFPPPILYLPLILWSREAALLANRNGPQRLPARPDPQSFSVPVV